MDTVDGLEQMDKKLYFINPSACVISTKGDYQLQELLCFPLTLPLTSLWIPKSMAAALSDNVQKNFVSFLRLVEILWDHKEL